MTDSAGIFFSDVAKTIGGEFHGGPPGDCSVRFLLTDSRQLISPSDTLFFALASERNDGHHYVEALLSKGVRGFVVSRVEKAWKKGWPRACFLVVDNPLNALQRLSAAHRGRFSYPVVAISGSNGKTVVKEWMAQLLSARFRLVKNPKSFNSQIGVPLSAWLMGKDHELGVFEAGISTTGEMERLETVLQPTIGIFTNIGPAHDEGFSDRKEKIREKLKLFTRSKSLIYCRDQPLLSEEIESWLRENPGVETYTWGKEAANNLRFAGKKRLHSGTSLKVLEKGREYDYILPFQDEASVENAMHCIACMFVLRVDPEIISSGLLGLQSVGMRLEMKEGVNNTTIINDSYNTDLFSLGIALDFMESQSRHRKKTVVLSDILQSGLPAEVLYMEVGKLLRAKGVDQLLAVGPDISANPACFSMPAAFFPSTGACLDHLRSLPIANESVLVKGARVFGFERISNLLQQKDHESVLEIRLDSLVHNLNVFRSLVPAGVKIMGVVKAFSYGSGHAEVARVLQYHQVDCLAVAYADEGKSLREAGVTLPIVVMNPEVQSLDILVRYNLEPEIYGLELLKRLIKALSNGLLKDFSSDSALPVHLKLDTGMHRLGFQPGDLDQLISLLLEFPAVRVASVFSHFAASEDVRHDDFSLHQIACFENLTEELARMLPHPFIRHMCNSTAIIRFPQAHYDMVRLGIGLYGIAGHPPTASLLQPVGTFRSVVSQVKPISKGESVGYGREAIAVGDMEVAIVPVGYADGLPRRLGNGKGYLLVGGHRARTFGHISMDMCALDVTGLEITEGDEVIVFGPGLDVEERAGQMGTIAYEVLTSVSQRVKRIYSQE